MCDKVDVFVLVIVFVCISESVYVDAIVMML